MEIIFKKTATAFMLHAEEAEEAFGADAQGVLEATRLDPEPLIDLMIGLYESLTGVEVSSGEMEMHDLLDDGGVIGFVLKDARTQDGKVIRCSEGTMLRLPSDALSALAEAARVKIRTIELDEDGEPLEFGEDGAAEDEPLEEESPEADSVAEETTTVWRFESPSPSGAGIRRVVKDMIERTAAEAKEGAPEGRGGKEGPPAPATCHFRFHDLESALIAMTDERLPFHGFPYEYRVAPSKADGGAYLSVLCDEREAGRVSLSLAEFARPVRAPKGELVKARRLDA